MRRASGSIVGHVFDVSNGRGFYGPGGGYDFFAFRDGSRAYATGDFTPVRVDWLSVGRRYSRRYGSDLTPVDSTPAL
jgi:hypothetical protein